MKCNNCGWNNREMSSHCEKCKVPLMDYASSAGRPTSRDIPKRTDFSGAEGNRYVAAKTIHDVDFHKCNQCHYPLLPGSSVCPNCGAVHGAEPEAQQPPQPQPPQQPQPQQCPKCHQECAADASYCSYCGHEMRRGIDTAASIRPKTITPWDMKPANYCRLKAIPNDKETIQQGTLTFAGDVIVLNRGNTESENLTITSKEQAVLICEAGKWYIQDRSEHKTTFIHTSERVELQSGDVIMLGNRRFEFEV